MTLIRNHKYLSFECYKDLRLDIKAVCYQAFIMGKNDAYEKNFFEFIEQQFGVDKNDY